LPKFGGIGPNRIQKPGGLLITEFKFLKNYKKSGKKYYKKLEQILSVLVSEDFFQIGNISFVKIQISSNIQKLAHMAHDL
jgi:hypothetical protein